MTNALPAPQTIGSPWRFFLFVFVLSIPFYVLGATGARLTSLPQLPASALMAFVPMVGASILVFCQRGTSGTVAWYRDMRNSHWHGHAVWYLTALLIMPSVCIAEFAILRLTGSTVPIPQFAFGEAMFMFAAFVIAAIGEEVGWQGYAYPALRTTMGVLTSALVLGFVWALWHVIPFVQLGRSTDWILWHSLSAVALRIIIVWLFENTGGSMIVAVLFHAMINLSWALFPVAGSYYDPLVTFIILAIASGLIAIRWKQKVWP